MSIYVFLFLFVFFLVLLQAITELFCLFVCFSNKINVIICEHLRNFLCSNGGEERKKFLLFFSSSLGRRGGTQSTTPGWYANMRRRHQQQCRRRQRRHNFCPSLSASPYIYPAGGFLSFFRTKRKKKNFREIRKMGSWCQLIRKKKKYPPLGSIYFFFFICMCSILTINGQKTLHTPGKKKMI